MKKIISIVITMILFVQMSLLCPNTVMAAVKGTKTIEDGTYIIRSAINNKFVLNVDGASKNDGANIQLWEYSNDAQKKFDVKYLGDGYYSIIATHSNKSLDVKNASTKVGANVWQYVSNNTDAQKWVIKDVGSGYYSIISKCNGLYVDVYNAVAANGTNIQMCDGNGLNAQKFKFEKVSTTTNTNTQSTVKVTGSKTINNGTYAIKSAINSNYAMDIKGASTANEANVQLSKYTKAASQKFQVTYLGDGFYSIIADHSKKSIDVKDASTKVGANVWQYVSNNTDAQKWVIKDVGNGYYSIISKCNGLYVDVYNAVAENGTNIQMCDGNGLNAQKWKFEEISTATTTNTQSTVQVTGSKTINNGTYAIKSAIDSTYAMDIKDASTANEANVQLSKYTKEISQKFQVTYLGDGFYSIIADHSGKSIDVKSASTKVGTNVWQYVSNNTDAQKWVIKDVGNGYYSIISKCNGLYVDVYNAVAANGTNIQMCDGNGLNAQKWIFEEIEKTDAKKTISDGTYVISSAINSKFALDVNGASKANGANIQLWEYSNDPQKRFKVTYLGDGYYSIIAAHSNKSIDVKNASKAKGANVWQYESNGTDAQKWMIKSVGNGYYSIISKCNGLYVDVYNAVAGNGTNIQMCDGNGLNAQKFKFEKVSININTSKYPGYKEKIEILMQQHPSWKFELLYTGLKYSDVIKGETAIHSRNLVPTTYGQTWRCATCGTKLWDSGWYCASEKAVAYYMDPRNFLNQTDVFQFLDVNKYTNGCTLKGIQQKVNNTFLQNYAKDIDTACKNQKVNSYYIIARLLQEQGSSGTTIGKGMDGGDGKTYYNPFNIGASGNGYSQIYANALETAKKYGWNSMEKAIEGGITFCKKNWLDNYQNTLYQNKFDIDTQNGTALYEHQYMQNLMAAQNEGLTLRSMYENTNSLESDFVFIIPVYEGMNTNTYQKP